MPSSEISRTPGVLTIPLGDIKHIIQEINPAAGADDADLVTIDDTSFGQLIGTTAKEIVADFPRVETALVAGVSNNDHRYIASIPPEDFIVPSIGGPRIVRVHGGPTNPEYYYLEFIPPNIAAFEIDIPLNQTFGQVYLDLIYTFAATQGISTMRLDIEAIVIRNGFAIQSLVFGESQSRGYVNRPYGTWRETLLVSGSTSQTFLLGAQTNVITTIPAPASIGARATLSIPVSFPATGRFGQPFTSSVTVNFRLKDVSSGFPVLPKMRLLHAHLRRVMA